MVAMIVDMAMTLGSPASTVDLARVSKETILVEIAGELYSKGGRDYERMIPFENPTASCYQGRFAVSSPISFSVCVPPLTCRSLILEEPLSKSRVRTHG
jgi:hypothetical protein